MTARNILLIILSLIICVSSERWSRQIPNAGVRPEEINDWIPLTQPINNDRTKNGRVLNYADNQFFQTLFNSNPPPPPPPAPPQSVAAQHASLEVPQQYQQRYVLPSTNEQTQSNHHQNIETLQSRNLQPQSPTSQSFFKFEMPTFNKDGSKQNTLPTVQTGYQIQHSFPHQAVVASPLFSPKPVFPTDFYPQFQPLVQQKIIQQNIIEDSKRPTKDKVQEIKSTKLPEITTPQPTAYPVNPNFHVQRPASFQQAKFPFQHQGQLAIPTSQEEEIQLLYVPYDTLYHQRNEPFTLDNKYNAVPPPISPSQINNFYTPEPLTNIDPNIYNPAPTTTTSTTFKPSTTYNAFLNPHFTSPKPKPKLKPHQPPLAMFALKTSNRPQIFINDVLRSLVNSKSITVLDSPSPSAPQIFIGPAGLPTPHGYTKFELPYLSSIDRNHLESRLQELPFFVAPLSYKAPSGFNKIVLPEPHVGSIILNKPFPVPEINVVQQQQQQELRTSTHRPVQPTKQVFITPAEEGQYQQSTTPRVIQSTPARYRYQFGSEIPPSANGYYNNENYQNIQSAPSPRQPPRTQNVNKNRPHFQKRPEERYQNQNQNPTSRPYANFRPMPNYVVNEEYFKVSPVTPSSTSTTTSTTTTTTTTEPLEQHVTEANLQNQAVEVETVRSNQIYSEVSGPQSETVRQRYNTRPNQYAANDDEYRMKTYFREQEAFRNRPRVQSTTVGDTVYENIQYTPVSLDYDPQQLYSIPSSTPSYFEGSTLRTTTPKERITFYTPIPQDQGIKSIKQPDEPVQYTHDENNNHPSQTEQPIQSSTNTARQLQTSEQIKEHVIPSNHRPTYSNEITYSHDVRNQDDDQEVEYEPNPYKLPTELPPLTPNLPGLVNALIEKDRLNAIEKEKSTTENPTTTPMPPYNPTRRPINRVKKPTVKVSSSTSVSYSSSSSSSSSSSDIPRRAITRGRRPYNPRNNNQTASSSSSSIITTTSTARSPTVRNPNRVRYNPTPEERRRYRPRIRTNLPATSSSKFNREEEDNIEYQRDVLKQNYPVFKPSSRKTMTTTTSTTERVTEPQAVVTVTPSNDKDEFAGLLEPMQIAQEYQQSPNYGPGYFPNAEEALPTEPIEVEKNEIHPIYHSSVITTTTEQVKETTRRPVFIRRPSRLQRTTTEVPQTTTTTTTAVNEERYTVRPRVRPDNSQRPRVVKIRTRTRKPHPASTTTTIGPERRSHDTGYQQLSRFNQDFFQDDQKDDTYEKDNHRSSNFNLETQESKWSPSLSHADSFRPVDPEDKAKFLKDNKKFENEPEIVTAGPQSNELGLKASQNTFLFNVSAGFGSAGKSYGSRSELKSTSENNITETTITDLLEDVISDRGRDQKKSKSNELPKETKTEEKPSSSSSSSSGSSTSHRRGVWRRVRLHSAADSFETAESQNLGNQIYNSIIAMNNQKQQNSAEVKKSNNERFSSTETTSSTEIYDNYENNDDATTIIPNDMDSSLIETKTEFPIVNTKLNKKNKSQEIHSRHVKKQLPTTTTTTAANIIETKDYYITTPVIPTNIIATVDSGTASDRIDYKSDEIENSTTISNSDDYIGDEDDNNDSVTDMITRRSDEIDDSENDNDDNEKYNKDDNNEDDLDSQPSIFDEVRKQLTDLFAIDDNDNNNDDTDSIKTNFKPRKQEYTSIQRIRAVTDNNNNNNTNNSDDIKEKQNNNNNNKLSENDNNKIITTTQTSPFHKNLMKNVIYATSTSTEISHETEICYRGRCVKAAKQL